MSLEPREKNRPSSVGAACILDSRAYAAPTGLTLFVSDKFYKHDAPTALKWVFNRLLMVAAQMRDQFNGLDLKLSQGLFGTAQNPNMSTLNIALSDPPTRPEVQTILDAFNTLLNQITRV